MTNYYRFVFLHQPTGETYEIVSFAANPARRDIAVRHGFAEHELVKHECWSGNLRLWHYEGADCIPG